MLICHSNAYVTGRLVAMDSVARAPLCPVPFSNTFNQRHLAPPRDRNDVCLPPPYSHHVLPLYKIIIIPSFLRVLCSPSSCSRPSHDDPAALSYPFIAPTQNKYNNITPTKKTYLSHFFSTIIIIIYPYLYATAL